MRFKNTAAMNLKHRNVGRLLSMLDVSKEKIERQGCGCFVVGYGVSYIDYASKTRDSIGHLLGYADLKGFWGPIGYEAQKPLVIKLRNKFGVNIKLYRKFSVY
jgi:hypothetical protein